MQAASQGVPQHRLAQEMDQLRSAQDKQWQVSHKMSCLYKIGGDCHTFGKNQSVVRIPKQ